MGYFIPGTLLDFFPFINDSCMVDINILVTQNIISIRVTIRSCNILTSIANGILGREIRIFVMGYEYYESAEVSVLVSCNMA